MNRNILWVPALLAGAAIVVFVAFTPPVGIDFVGGSMIELTTQITPTEAEELLQDTAGVTGVAIETGEGTVQIRAAEISTDQHTEFLAALADIDPDAVEDRFDVIGPVFSRELVRNAALATFLGVVGILMYLAYAFRGRSKTLSPWSFGTITIVVLCHDIIFAAGAFTVYAYFSGATIDTLFVTALLAILGYSVNDTIVVANRIASDMRTVRLDFPDLVRRSVWSSVTRSVNTSTTTLLVLVSLFLFGGEATQPFVFTLIAGVVAGTYSSLLVGPPLMVAWQQRNNR